MTTATTTASVATYVKPIGMFRRYPWPYGGTVTDLEKLRRKNKFPVHGYGYIDYGPLMRIESLQKNLQNL